MPSWFTEDARTETGAQVYFCITALESQVAHPESHDQTSQEVF
jgi:hypothetical protein